MYIQGLSILTSAQCNLNCSYCYVTKKTKSYYNKAHSKILESIENKTFLSIIEDLDIGKNITDLSLWGREPTFTMHKYGDNINYIKNILPKLNRIYFSTNFKNIDNLLLFLDKLIDKDISITCQISIDVGEELTNTYRGKNLYRTILNNMKKIFQYVEISKYPNIRFVEKSTLCKESIKTLSFNDNLKLFLLPHLEETNELLDKYPSINIERFSANVDANEDFEVIDGKNLSILIEKYIDLNSEYSVINVPFIHKVREVVDRLENKNQNLPNSCSASNRNITLDQDNNIARCHHDYFTENRSFPCTKNNIIINKYNIGSYHFFNKLKFDYSTAILHELFLSGNVSKGYEYKGKYHPFIDYFFTLENCFMHNNDVTGQYSITPIEMFLLFCNGTFEKLLKVVINERQNKII